MKAVVYVTDNTATSLRTFAGGSAVEAKAEVQCAKEDGRWSVDFAKSVLIQKLVGATGLWHRDNGRACVGFDKWVEAFEKEFIPPMGKGEITMILINTKQNKGEEVYSYARRVDNLARRAGWEMPENKAQILKGLSRKLGCLITAVYGVRSSDGVQVGPRHRSDKRLESKMERKLGHDRRQTGKATLESDSLLCVRLGRSAQVRLPADSYRKRRTTVGSYSSDPE